MTAPIRAPSHPQLYSNSTSFAAAPSKFSPGSFFNRENASHAHGANDVFYDIDHRYRVSQHDSKYDPLA